jgi:hypothetical protein
LKWLLYVQDSSIAWLAIYTVRMYCSVLFWTWLASGDTKLRKKIGKGTVASDASELPNRLD